MPEPVILSNGMKLWVVGNGEDEINKLSIYMTGGAFQEDCPMQATACSMAVFNGNKNMTYAQIAEAIDFYGAWRSMQVYDNCTAFAISSLNENFERTLPIFIDSLRFPTFPDNEFELNKRQLSVNCATAREKVKYIANKAILRLYYGENHPLATDPTPEHINSLTQKHILDFYNQHYKAQNCNLVIAGKITDREINTLETVMSQWKADSQPTPISEPPASPSSEMLKIVNKSGAVQSAIFMMLKTVPRGHKDYFKLRILTTLLIKEDLFNTEYMNTVRFRPLTTLLDSNIYAPTLSDFILTEGPHAGDTVSKQTFMCMMYSALDPKKPFGSRVYVNLENHKPIVQMHYITDCNLTASFTNQSYALSDVPINPDSTRWVFFADSTDAHPLDTLWGDTVSYHFESEGYYRVELRASLQGMDCSSIKAQICHLMTPHELPIILVEGRLCEGETCVAWTTGDEELAREWRVDDSLLAVTCYPFDTIRFTPRIGFHTLSLTTTTGLCFATTDTVFRVFGDDTITSSANGKPICVGDSVTLSILGIEHPVWSSDPYDSTLVGYENENVVTVVPKETTTYTVQPMGDSRCLQVPTSVTINVSPYPVPVVWTDRYALELTRPSLHIEDRSPFSNSSHWIFSDGQTADGAVVNHTFELIGDSVTITLHTCNGSGCCVDTTVVIPVEINLLWIPNVFTPDQPQNNLFQLVTSLHIIYYEIWIYNRLGLLVYHGNDINQAWNGIDLHGNACPQGAYVYHYVFSCMQDPTRRHTGDGTVTLLR